MKKHCLILFFIILSVTMMAQRAWTVETVPNTRLEGNDIHVSDPDGFLSDSTEATINTALCAIREQADVFVVTLASIGEAEPRHFATALFNNWGIGDAETNNGVLLLFVEDQHALETETGYGVESILTDVKCERIFNNIMAPCFRVGDYEGGLCSGVAEIVTVFGGEVPMGLKANLPANDDEDSESFKWLDDLSVWFFLFFFIIALFPVIGIIFWGAKNKTKDPTKVTSGLTEEDGVTYVEGFKTSWSGSPWDGKGCLGGLMVGMSIFVIFGLAIAAFAVFCSDFAEHRKFYINWSTVIALFLYLTWICFRHNHRVLKTAKKLAKTSFSPKSIYEAALNHEANKVAIWMAPWLGWIYYLILKKKVKESKDCQCPNCGEEIQQFGDFNLSEEHLAEERVDALKFSPFRCANGHVIVVKEHGEHFADFSTCSKCGAYTLKLVKTEIVREADYNQSGEKEETYECQHCGDVFTKTIEIAKLVNYSSGGSSHSSSGSHYHSSSHSSRGSFGGGRSGGGGHSGRW